MEPLMLLLMLVLNFGISWWNAYACGAYLTESKLIGGWTRVVVICGLVMSVCGFTWVYVALLGMGAVAAEFLTPADAELLFKLGYLIIIGPVLASGLGLWAHSLIVAYRERSFGSVAIAGWNTYAQAHNTWQAASNAGSFLSDVIEGLSGKNRKSSKDGAAAILIILIAIIAVAGGYLTTMAIARRADRKIALDVTGREPLRA